MLALYVFLHNTFLIVMAWLSFSVATYLASTASSVRASVEFACHVLLD